MDSATLKACTSLLLNRWKFPIDEGGKDAQADWTGRLRVRASALKTRKQVQAFRNAVEEMCSGVRYGRPTIDQLFAMTYEKSGGSRDAVFEDPQVTRRRLAFYELRGCLMRGTVKPGDSMAKVRRYVLAASAEEIREFWSWLVVYKICNECNRNVVIRVVCCHGKGGVLLAEVERECFACLNCPHRWTESPGTCDSVPFEGPDDWTPLELAAWEALEVERKTKREIALDRHKELLKSRAAQAQRVAESISDYTDRKNPERITRADMVAAVPQVKFKEPPEQKPDDDDQLEEIPF